MKTVIENCIKTITLKWIFIGILGYAIAMVTTIYLLVNPQFKRYQQAVDKQVGLSDTYINLISLDIEAAIDTIISDLKELKFLESNFNERLLQKKSVNSVLPIIDRYCTESKLHVEKLEPNNKTKFLPPKYQKQFIETRLLGRFNDFLRLLQKLETNPEWIVIEKLSITPIDNGSRNQFDLMLTVLQEKDQA